VYCSAKLLLWEGRTLPPFLPACLPTTLVPATAKALDIGAAAAAAAANKLPSGVSICENGCNNGDGAGGGSVLGVDERL